jgi:hypothetical protein
MASQGCREQRKGNESGRTQVKDYIWGWEVSSHRNEVQSGRKAQVKTFGRFIQWSM